MRYTIYSVGRFLRPLYRRLIPAVGGHCRLLDVSPGEPPTVTDYRDGRWVRGATLHDPVAELTGDMLVTWNGLIDCYARVVTAARERGMRTALLEGGALRGTLQVDPQGTNGASSLVGIDAERFRVIPADPGLYRETFTARPVNSALHREPLPCDLQPLPARYVVLPMQTHGDTQLTHFAAPHRQRMESLLAEVNAAMPLPSPPLVVKEHPWEHGRAHYDDLRKEYPHCYWCRTRDMDSLLAGAAAVVTVNSTVGVQAMQRRIPVVTLGLAYYSKAGLVLDGTRDLRGAIAGCLDAPSDSYDADLRIRFLSYLRHYYLVPETDTAALANRLRDIHASRAPWLEVLQ
jgi:capsular polysaccharide export protein